MVASRSELPCPPKRSATTARHATSGGRIHVTYRLAADERQRPTIERVLGFHADHCPVARTIGGYVAISTSLDLSTDR